MLAILGAFPLDVFSDAVGLHSQGRERLLPYARAVFNALGPDNQLHRDSLAAAAPHAAGVAGQCRRENLLPGGFGADIYAAADTGEITPEEAAMPIMVCEFTKALDPAIREKVAHALTTAVHAVIGSELELISVVLRQPDPDQLWTAGKPSNDALIFCYIRAGRPEALKSELALRVSAAWHAAVGTDEDSIEVAVFETPASQTARGGRRLPEPPYSVLLAAQ